MPKGIFVRTEYWLQRLREGHRTPEYHDKMSKIVTEYYKNNPVTPERRVELSLIHKGKHGGPQPSRRGKPTWNKGLTKETSSGVAKTAQSKIGKHPVLRKGTAERRLKEKEEKYCITQDVLEYLYLEKLMIVQEIAELLEVTDNTIYGFMQRYKIIRRTHRETMLVRPDLYREWYNNTSTAASKLMTELHSDPNFLLKIISGIHRKPTKIELELEKLLLDNKLPYKYVGDGQIIIGYWNPDFINIDGKKKLLELFGNYWHRNDNPQKRIDKFARYGFQTLVIWESELKKTPELVLQKIKEFDGVVD